MAGCAIDDPKSGAVSFDTWTVTGRIEHCSCVRLCGWIFFAALLAWSIESAKADIKINPANLPNGIVGSAYSATLNASGCSGSCLFSSKGTLPPGLSLVSTSGTISGTPTSAGTFPFMITATDQKSNSASQSYSINIAGPVLTISTSSPLPDGKVGTPYSQTLGVAGGAAPYTWSVTAGTLAGVISLNASSGTLSGTPTTANTFSFTVQVVDKNRASATKAFALTIAPSTPPLTITTAASLPGGTVGAAYAQPITASGGATPYTWAVTGGSLPPGLSLNASNGALAGTPTSAGTFNFTIQVKDASNATATQAFTATMASGAPKLTIVTNALPAGTVGSGYSQTLTASGGTPPYSWAITSGTLPDGLGLDSASGFLGGTPSKAGTFAFTLRVTDKSSAVADQSLQVSIGSAPPTPSLSFSGLPDTTGSGVQMPLNLVLSPAPTQLISGQIVLAFQPDGAAGRDDPAVEFSTGSRTAPFTIPAGATTAVFSGGGLAFQTGTVAGTLTFTVNSNLPGNGPSHTIVVPRTGPTIAGASLVKSSSGFELQVTGFSNTRELGGASFHFTAAAGQTVQTTDLNVSLASVANQWYTSGTSTQFGGQFLVVVPFSVTQGAVSSLSAVSVQLQNGQGVSASATANF